MCLRSDFPSLPNMKTDVDVYAGSWGLCALLWGTAASALWHKQLPCGACQPPLHAAKAPKGGSGQSLYRTLVYPGKVD